MKETEQIRYHKTNTSTERFASGSYNKSDNFRLAKLEELCELCKPATQTSEEAGKVFKIPVNDILPNKAQPRKSFDDDTILRLADSIRRYGILQPICIRKLDHDGNTNQTYELIAGERRLRAAKLLEMKTIPSIIISADEKTSAALALIENIQRENLNMFEQASAIYALADIYKMTQEQIAAQLSSSQSYVANKLRILKLSEEEREMIIEGNLTERHARALLRIRDIDERKNVIRTIISRQMNVHATEGYIDRLLCLKGINTEAVDNKKRKLIIKDMKLFYNTIDRALDTIRQSGVSVSSEKKIVGNDEGIELIIKIMPPERSKDTA